LLVVRTLVVLPTYNEVATIERIVRAVRANLPDAHVLVVDDSSPDGTGKVVGEVAEELGEVDLLTRATKDGLGNAYKAGFTWGLEQGYEIFIEMDSDFSHDPKDLPRLVGAMVDDVEVVIGSRYVKGGTIPDWAFSRRLISRGGNEYARILLHLGVSDSTAGFRAYRASVLERIDFASVKASSYCFQIEMTYLSRLADARIVEVPIRFVDRKEGVSKMSSHTVTEALLLITTWGLERLFRRAPGRAALRGISARV
jgi:dolichol-phosphate mannosyltransferase